MSITRRSFGLAAAALPFARLAHAGDWREDYPELTMAVVPAENATGVQERFAPFSAYLTRELRVPVRVRTAQDYAAVIEGQRAGNVHIAYYGSASFARARMTGVKTEAFAINVDADGSKSYRSVFYVLAKSPYQRIEDLKGKTLALVDPNSTSGNNVPRFELHKRGIDPESYFAKVLIAGSHENSVLSLVQGTVDVAVDSWTSPEDCNLARMVRKKMLKSADGQLLAYDDFRIILTSDPILNGPFAYLESLPEPMKADIRQAFFEVATKDRDAFDRLSDGQRQPWQPAKTSDWDQTIKLVQFVDELRKRRS